MRRSLLLCLNDADQNFLRLVNAISMLYPIGSDENRLLASNADNRKLMYPGSTSKRVK